VDTTLDHYVGLGGGNDTKIWFCTPSNQVVAVTNAGVFVRYDNNYDYAVFVFNGDLTNAITPMAVMTPPSSIGVRFRTCQHGPYGYMSANMPPFSFSFDTSRPPFNEVNTFEGGDSGSPNMIPTTDGSLVFIDGSSTRGALSIQMQMDMDFLCTNGTYNLNLNITNYQLNWYTNYP
jgi:hypothetical protein